MFVLAKFMQYHCQLKPYLAFLRQSLAGTFQMVWSTVIAAANAGTKLAI
jgi:hypothetical protein